MGLSNIALKLGSISIDSLAIGETTHLDGSILTIGKQDAIAYLGSHDGVVSGLDLADLICKLKWQL